MVNAAALIRTIVAWYGAKAKPLAELIIECQQRIAAGLGREFRPYVIEQVHSTLISLDPPEVAPPAPIDLDGLLAFLQATPWLPMHIQIGGFTDRPYDFTSRGQLPYARSFALRDGKAVVLGWPLNSATGEYPLMLETLRRELQQFGVLHHYHRLPTDVDNDAYFRIGLYDTAAIEVAALRDTEAELRQYLAKRRPTIVDITVDDLSVAISSDETLAPHSTRIAGIRDSTNSRNLNT